MVAHSQVSSIGLLKPGASLTALLIAPRKATLQKNAWARGEYNSHLDLRSHLQVITASADGTAKLFDVDSGVKLACVSLSKLVEFVELMALVEVNARRHLNVWTQSKAPSTLCLSLLPGPVVSILPFNY